MSTPFLTAQWKNLVMLNYEVDPVLLNPRLPAGVELDRHDGRAYASVVGFQFIETRVLGYEVPFHRDFAEVNLRFYVRRSLGSEWRRGVVFIRELVPRAAIAIVARVVYNEPYRSVPLVSEVTQPESGTPGRAEYRWRSAGNDVGFRVEFDGVPSPLAEGSLHRFIAEHYYGYGVTHDQATLEYRVEHPPWKAWDAKRVELIGDVGGFYGGGFTDVLRGEFASAFIADGSEVVVHKPVRLEESLVSQS